MNLFEQVQDVIATTLQVPLRNVSTSTKADDLAAWDSLGHINLMMALEQTFGITLDVEDFSRLDSVPEILDYLRQQGKN